MTIELLTIEDIAALYKVSHYKARDQVVRVPGFPTPAPGSTARSRRWLASDVEAFIRRKPVTNGKPSNADMKGSRV
jgi:hypothetical protein